MDGNANNGNKTTKQSQLKTITASNKDVSSLLREISSSSAIAANDSSEQFAKILLNKSLANLCLSLGFTVADDAAFNGLAKICKERILSIGRSLKSVAEASGRKRVILEDFIEVVPTSTEFHGTSREPLRYLVGIPDFPVEASAHQVNSLFVSEDAAVQTISDLPHFPPLPPIHTYKRTKLELPEIPASSAAELRRAQQRHSALVREALAKMRRDANPGAPEVKESDEADLSGGDNLARLMEGDFES
jgi:hypothetical protein